MSQYLIFQLHGPMASWGVDAPGEVRHTHELPSRSALLGLLAAGVGIRRDDTERLNAFNRHYSLVVCASRNPRWARDYHTIQMPKEVRKARYFSRREELSDPDLLSAIISRRDYYTDALVDGGGGNNSRCALQPRTVAGRFTPSSFSSLSGAKKSSAGITTCAVTARRQRV